jgi:hypothetical protein
MAYTPPSGDSIAFVFSESYTAPAGDAVQFNFSGDIDVIIPEIAIGLAADVAGVSGDLNVIIPEILISLAGEAACVSHAVAIPEITSQIDAAISGALQGQFIAIPGIELSLGGSAALVFRIPIPEISTGFIGAAGVMDFAVPVGEAVFGLSAEALGVSTFTTEAALIRYYLTVTGAADGVDDIEIPMSSFQARRRSGEPTYLTAVVPSADYAAAIAARANGTLRIDQGYVLAGSILQREPIMETDIDEAAIHHGGRQSSIRLTGYREATYTPKAITLSGATYRGVSGGKIRYRLAKPYIFLNPGDTVTIEDDTLTIGVMSYSISPLAQQIEIQEA